MHIEQIYTGCLAQGAYFIESEGEAAIIDPLRESDPYLEKAASRGVAIKFIFETHFHADFISGHLDLAKKTGAKIIFGPGAETSYEKYQAEDGELFQLGKVTIKVLHTPGHTPESTTYLLVDEIGKEHAIFTGDTLFIGDVGRPDLAQQPGELSKEDLASMLYESLRNKIMTLPDEVLVYPAHGAGSACGKNMSKETWSTLGIQKRSNYALREDMTKGEFIKEVLNGLMPPPQYFSKNAQLNKIGYESLDKVMRNGDVGLSTKEFELLANETEALILDVRPKEEFVLGFIPNSIFIGLNGSFAPWVGALINDLQQSILIVAPMGKEAETVKRLARVGYDNSLGYLQGGFETWKAEGREIDTIETIDAATFGHHYQQNRAIQILDVRKPGEWEKAHVEGAQNLALDFLNANMGNIQASQQYYLHCRSGYRSTIAASILKARGYQHLINVQGRFDEFGRALIPIEDFSCSVTERA